MQNFRKLLYLFRAYTYTIYGFLASVNMELWGERRDKNCKKCWICGETPGYEELFYNKVIKKNRQIRRRKNEKKPDENERKRAKMQKKGKIDLSRGKHPKQQKQNA